MSRREVLGFAPVACVACCTGPVLGVLGAISALGVVSTVLIGAAGFAIAFAAIEAFIALRRRGKGPGADSPEPVAVELTRPAP